MSLLDSFSPNVDLAIVIPDPWQPGAMKTVVEILKDLSDEQINSLIESYREFILRAIEESGSNFLADILKTADGKLNETLSGQQANVDSIYRGISMYLFGLNIMFNFYKVLYGTIIEHRFPNNANDLKSQKNAIEFIASNNNEGIFQDIANWFDNSGKIFEIQLIDFTQLLNHLKDLQKIRKILENIYKYSSSDKVKAALGDLFNQYEAAFVIDPELEILLLSDFDREDEGSKLQMIEVANKLLDPNTDFTARVLNYIESKKHSILIESDFESNILEVLFMDEFEPYLLDFLRKIQRDGNEFAREWALSIEEENFEFNDPEAERNNGEFDNDEDEDEVDNSDDQNDDFGEVIE